jgi:cytochrome b561
MRSSARARPPFLKSLHLLAALLLIGVIAFAPSAHVDGAAGRAETHMAFGKALVLAMIVMGALSATLAHDPPPSRAPAWTQTPRRTLRLALYALIPLQGVLGIWLAAIAQSAMPVGGFDLAQLAPADPQFYPRLRAIHAINALVIVGLVIVHILAAFAHLLLWRDGVFASILPFSGAFAQAKGNQPLFNAFSSSSERTPRAMTDTFRAAPAVKPERGDLWVASTLISDKALRLGLSRVWLLSPALEIKSEIATRHYGMISGLAIEPASGDLFAFDPTARAVSRISREGALLPDLPFNECRPLGSGIFLGDGGLLAGEHFSGVEPPFIGDGRLLQYAPDKRLARLHRPQTHGGVAHFLGLTHMALMRDGKTLCYVSETGDTVFRYDIEKREQLAPLYVRKDPPAMVFGVAAAPNDYLLVMTGAAMRCLNRAGEVVRDYALPAGRGWSFVRLSRDEKSAWVGDFFVGQIARIDLSNGAVLQHKSFDLPFSLTAIVEAK